MRRPSLESDLVTLVLVYLGLAAFVISTFTFWGSC